MSQVDVALNVHDLGVVDIWVCHFPPSPLSSTCSSSDPDFQFRQLISVAFIEVHMWCVSAYEYVVSEAKTTMLFAVYF